MKGSFDIMHGNVPVSRIQLISIPATYLHMDRFFLKHKHLWLRILLLTVAFQLVSCAPFKVPDRTAPPVELPASYSLDEAVTAPPQRWWETFHSLLLDQLIVEALSGNQTLRSYWARLARAQALARKS
ncbi:MAG: hypothetical protein OEM01_12900, partial [Desulfobulbaceae bacterium]|nr:hypothetical protein [Desulfobulbaceae bacterium]